MSPSKPVRIGILGTASIARKLIGGEFRSAKLAGIASRSLRRAQEFAADAGIPRVYDSYESLLADPEIDAVYIPLPQHLHCEYTIRAAEAGKHVLVEKPAAVTSDEVIRMGEACKQNGVLFMEALMYRFRNIHCRAKQILDEGTIGKLRFLVFAWSHNIMNRGHDGFRLQKEEGGGCLRDLGVYGVDWIRFITGSDPEMLNAVIQRNELGLDLFAHATYKAGDVVATMTCGYSTDVNYYYLSGEKGSIYSPVSLSGRVLPGSLHIHLLGNDSRYTEQFPAENAYVMEMEYFARCILDRTMPHTDAANAELNLKYIEQIEAEAVLL